MKTISRLLIGIILFSSCQQHNDSSNQDSPKEDSNWALLSFEKLDSVNPISFSEKNSFIDPILKKKIYWERKSIFSPSVILKNDTMFMLYSANDGIGKAGGTSRIGLAVSLDGIHFKQNPAPVLYPDNDAYKVYEVKGGCKDPRVVQDEMGIYYMTYTAFDGDSSRLFVATSSDLIHWKKYGHAFSNVANGKYMNPWTRSGSIVCKNEKGKIVAAKINDKYWMYFGDCFIWAATSDDLIHWTPVEMSSDEKAPVPLKSHALAMPSLKIIVPTRKGKFDSDVVDVGPQAMLTDKGIILIYNSKNNRSAGDASLPDLYYTASQVLLDKDDPTKVIHRMENYFMKPDKKYELNASSNNNSYLQGLTFFKNKWWLYYSTADSKIAVAVKK